jgi:hypothetical protein
MSEGLATWQQGTERGHSIELVTAMLIRRGEGPLESYLDEDRYYQEDNNHNCDILAASFTGFLIRHFSWDTYTRFYRRMAPDKSTFLREFEAEFGLSFDSAEKMWRETLPRGRTGKREDKRREL